MSYKDIKMAKERARLRYLSNRETILKLQSIHQKEKRQNETLEEKEIRLIKKRNYYQKNKIKIQNSRKKNYKRVKLNCLYGITPEQYDELILNQNNLCAICGKKDTTKITSNNFPLVVDHCHTTNKVRGLLCSQCNIMLGMSKNNINILKNAIKYLEDNK